MKNFFNEFKKFITRGNVVDLAVAVIVGGAFGKIVTSLVNDVVMPLISLAVGGANVSDWKWVIKPAVYDASGVLVTAENSLNYGNFIQTIIDFLIIAFFIFVAIKIVSLSQKKLKELEEDVTKKIKKIKHKKGEEVVEEMQIEIVKKEAPETTEKILKDIRDLLSAEKKESQQKEGQEENNNKKNAE